jgi:hypothetical protein
VVQRQQEADGAAPAAQAAPAVSFSAACSSSRVPHAPLNADSLPATRALDADSAAACQGGPARWTPVHTIVLLMRSFSRL